MACWPAMAPAVYPRVCGGTGAGAAGMLPDKGLSPRVRGNQKIPGLIQPGAGSIPACAGEPARPTGCPRRSKVYPRVCGGTSM